MAFLKHLLVSTSNANIHVLRKSLCSLAFVPKHNPSQDVDVETLTGFLRSHSRILVLTGAGVSTESGIPDYRSEEVGLYARSSTRPVKFQDFMKSPSLRKRYWARNYFGWPRFSSFSPNETHYSLSKLEELNKLQCIVTQNVDRLHHKAGSKNVIELHGSTFKVMCMGCDTRIDRHVFQEKLAELNSNMVLSATAIRPDGDVDLPQNQVDTFCVPSCDTCGGVLKPDIVFFGESVPMARVQLVKKNVEMCDSVLVLGSSLSVFSGYRIVLQAKQLNKAVVIVNIGDTRGDQHCKFKLNVRCGDVFPKCVE
ncbi:NAD-dependent protein deacylase Sirt4-like [Bacillus rossius redtenbacheri]|uniref:NAD-dependent protein deacylase Sirt4-like n=1 Tax=Bacillus rossius redtenbacheri TaxID=93214 RepID=UPI002FDE6A40